MLPHANFNARSARPISPGQAATKGRVDTVCGTTANCHNIAPVRQDRLLHFGSPTALTVVLSHCHARPTGWLAILSTGSRGMDNNMLFYRTLITLFLLALPHMAAAAERMVSLEGEADVRIWVFTPREAGSGPWPLAMMIPAGSGQEYAVKAQSWLGREMTRRGWVVAVPVSPEGLSFVGDSENNISQVIAALQQDDTIDVGKTLLLGVSSGGSSALEIASKNPAAYHGVVAVPGRIKQSGPLPALDGLPVFLRVAEKDYFRWHKKMQDMTQRLESAGARVDAALVPDARHIIKVDLDELDRWLSTLTLDRRQD